MKKQTIVKTIRISFAALLLTVGVTANATTFDFVSMANPFNAVSNPTGIGEQGFSTLSLSGAGFMVAIAGTKGSSAAFAYLDAGHGGLGVCGVLTSAKQCNLDQSLERARSNWVNRKKAGNTKKGGGEQWQAGAR